MKAPKNIELKLPEDIENVETNMMQYRIAESRNAYLKLIKNRGIEYYKSRGELGEQLSKYNITVIDQAIEELKDHLEKERRDYKPLGYRFNEEVIEIELDMYDTLEEQIEYIKQKLREFDLATLNIHTNEYDYVKNYLKQILNNRQQILKNEELDGTEKKYSEYWDEIIKSHFEPYRINQILEQVGMQKEDSFIDFMKRKFRRFKIEEWLKEYDTKNKLEQIDRIKKDEKLSELEKHLRSVKVWEYNYLDSVIGGETLSRLKSFEEKFILEKETAKVDKKINQKADEILQEIIDIRKKVEDYKKEIRSKKRELKIFLDENESLEKEFDKDVTEFPKNLKEDIKSKREQISSKKKEIFDIEKKLWGTVGEGGGLTWRHDRLFDEYKKLIIDEDELFDELKNKSIGRYTDKIQQKIKEVLKSNKIEVNDKEMLDIVQEVLGKRIEDEDAWYKEFSNEDDDEENYEKEINEVLKGRYNIIDETDEYPLFNFEFERIKKYSSKLEPDKARMYLKYILKEFDREKRENNLLFWTQEDIEYISKNVIIDDLTKLEQPPTLEDLGRSARISLAKENFEKNVLNEITFIEEKEKLKFTKGDEVNSYDPIVFEKIIDQYFEYGKECYLATWKDEYQILAFEKKMIDKFGQDVKKDIFRLFKYISKKTNPIEFLGCDYEKVRKNYNKEELKNEINRIDKYISEIEKLEFYTADENNINSIPDDELEKYNEWQCYYIEKIKYKELAEWINILRINRPGLTDYKYGEFYPVDFKRVTEFALEEFTNYKKNLQNLQVNPEVDTKNIIIGTSNKQLKSFGRGELQEALGPIAKEFKLIIGESAPQKKVRLITKKLIEDEWDAKESSVAEALRKMGYVKGKRK